MENVKLTQKSMEEIKSIIVDLFGDYIEYSNLTTHSYMWDSIYSVIQNDDNYSLAFENDNDLDIIYLDDVLDYINQIESYLIDINLIKLQIDEL